MEASEINCIIANTAAYGSDMVSIEKHYKRNVLDVKILTETGVQPRSAIWAIIKVWHDKMLINL